jgi:hypothetical protein
MGRSHALHPASFLVDEDGRAGATNRSELFDQFFELKRIDDVALEQYETDRRGLAQKRAFFPGDCRTLQSGNESAIRHGGGLARAGQQGKRTRQFFWTKQAPPDVLSVSHN